MMKILGLLKRSLQVCTQLFVATSHRQSATGTCNTANKSTTILHDAREFFASFLFANMYMQPIGIGQSSKTFEPAITNDQQNGSAKVNDELASGPKTNGDQKPWESVNDDLAMCNASSELGVQSRESIQVSSFEFRVSSQYRFGVGSEYKFGVDSQFKKYIDHTRKNNFGSKPPSNDSARVGSLSFLFNNIFQEFFNAVELFKMNKLATVKLYNNSVIQNKKLRSNY